MKNKILFILSILGVVVGLVSAYVYGIEKPPVPPVFKPATNPYEKGIYANGIIESHQNNGQNINIFPEVSGTVVKILVREGDTVAKGAPLLVMDDAVQRATAQQQKAQAAAALALLEEMKAQPRKETLAVVQAQVELAAANLKTAQDQLAKQRKSYELDPQSISQDALDNAENAAKVARANLEVAQRQLSLTKAGAWSYDIRNQEGQYQALSSAYQASQSLLGKYTITAPVEGVVLSVNTAVGCYLSPQGVYNTYTQGSSPVLVMGSSQDTLGVRCFIDEILIHRLPTPEHMEAQMSIRGTEVSIPLKFERMQPYVSPKIQLSNQRTERVDVRVLPLVFSLQRPKGLHLYPGQLVDVYIGEKPAAR